MLMNNGRDGIFPTIQKNDEHIKYAFYGTDVTLVKKILFPS